MRSLLAAFLVCFTLTTSAQQLHITVDAARSQCFDTKRYADSRYRASIDSAFVIMSAVLSSDSFRGLLRGLEIPCDIRCCTACRHAAKVINSREIMDSLYKQTTVSMAIDLQQSCDGELGHTYHHSYLTTACLANIVDDMDDLPPSYAIAVNLCHEYMHQVGFRHHGYKIKDLNKTTPNPDGYAHDLAYRIGWDTYWLLARWHRAGVRIDGL